MTICFRCAFLALMLVITESAFPAVDSNSEDLKTATAADTEAESEVEEFEDQAVKTAMRVKQLRRVLKEARQVATVVSGKDDDLLPEESTVAVDKLKVVKSGVARGFVTTLWKNALKLERRIHANEAWDAEALGVPHTKVSEVEHQLAEAKEEAQQAKSDLKRARGSALQSERAVASAQENEHGREEAALEGQISPIEGQLQSAYIVLGRAAIESEEAAKNTQIAEEQDAKLTQDTSAAGAALQVARQELAPLSGQLQSLAIIEVSLRQNASNGDLPDVSQIAQSANLGDVNDAKKADAVLKTTKSSLAKMEQRWQSVNAQRTSLHHSLQEKVIRLASDAEDFQSTLHRALSADLSLLNGLHGLGSEEISCNGAREDLSRIQGYLKQLRQKEQKMQATVTQLKAKKSPPLAKLLRVSESADKNAIRLVKKASKPGSNIANSALEDSAQDALGDLEAKARSLEQKIAKLEDQKVTQAPLVFKLHEDRAAEPALATAVQHAKSAVTKACQINIHLAHLRAEARDRRGEAQAFGTRLAASERMIYGIQHDLATLGENRRKVRKELHSLRNRTVILSEDAGRLSEASRLTKLLSTKQPWEVEETIADERVELEGQLTRKRVAVHERERILSELQSQIRQSQIKLEKGLKGLSTGQRDMAKATQKVRDLEKKVNALRKRLQKQRPGSQLGSVSKSSAAVGKLRGKHRALIH